MKNGSTTSEKLCQIISCRYIWSQSDVPMNISLSPAACVLALLHVLAYFARKTCLFPTKSSEFVLILRLFAFMQNMLIYVLMA